MLFIKSSDNMLRLRTVLCLNKLTFYNKQRRINMNFIKKTAISTAAALTATAATVAVKAKKDKDFA